jgi:hypothetical protein
MSNDADDRVEWPCVAAALRDLSGSAAVPRGVSQLMIAAAVEMERLAERVAELHSRNLVLRMRDDSASHEPNMPHLTMPHKTEDSCYVWRDGKCHCGDVLQFWGSDWLVDDDIPPSPERSTLPPLEVPATHRPGFEPLTRLIGDIDYCLTKVNPAHEVGEILIRVGVGLRYLNARHEPTPTKESGL